MPLFQSRLFLRIIKRNREIYFLKIITLAVAFACTTLITLFSLNEFGFDQFHQDAQSIFRVLQKNTSDTHSGNRLSVLIPQQAITAFQANDSLVVSRVKAMNEVSIFAKEGVSHHQKIHAADSTIINIFSFELTGGSLKDFNNGVLLSESAARKYFGTVEAAGSKLKIQSVGDTLSFNVAAVFKDYPQNSHEEFRVFIPFTSSSIKELGFDPYETGLYGKALESKPACGIPQLKVGELSYTFQPLPDIFFGPRVLGEDAQHGDSYSILILICITSLILFLALSTFVNLTTLTLPYRSKELAIKKLAGMSQFKLILMFAKESFWIVAFSWIIGVAVIAAVSDFLKSLLGLDLLALFLTGDSRLIITSLLLIFVLGLAPLFLTFKFARATPTSLLSTETITFPRFKRVITFLQLGVSIFLIVASVVIKRQVNYSLLKEPGRNHEQVVYMSYPEGLTHLGLRNLRENWKKFNPNIVDVMATSQLPNHINSKELNSDFYFISVDPEFRDFFNLKMVEGNWFKPNAGDSVFVVNEKAKSILPPNQQNVIGVVSGLMGQFNLPEKPVKIYISPSFQYNYLCVRILEVDIRKTVQYLSNYFEPGARQVSFLNARFEEWVNYQDRLNRLSDFLAIISAILSCCAIYGLSVSIVRDKLKQIAIRKICGANTFHIVRVLVKEFSEQMFLAILIFGPFTYIVIKELLRNFVYATPFHWLDPLLPLLYCGLVIIILCGFQALNLRKADLARSLKG
jgi:putative ABC transport system permease protein